MQLHLIDGVPDQPPKRPIRSKEQYRKFIINYRKSDDKTKTCKKCKHSTFQQVETFIHPITQKEVTAVYLYKYRKCPFIGFSRGQATDIKSGYICDKYEGKEIIEDESK